MKEILKKYVPIIAAAFAISALVPAPMSTGDGILSNLSGIAMGFGFAYLFQFLVELSKLKKQGESK